MFPKLAGIIEDPPKEDCVTCCVRPAFLLSEGELDRKQWIELRLQDLADIFAVAVGGFSVMDNHLHVLVRLDPDIAQSSSDEEIVRRWGRVFPPRDKSRQPLPVSNACGTTGVRSYFLRTTGVR
jgi:REP element-mobilizing transposase RayT